MNRRTGNTGPKVPYCDLVVTGTHADVTALRDAVRASGRLVYMSAPAQVSADDPRIRIVIRLTPTH
ncbi:hypothetical protein O7623_10850 [Solwaraspora sp. WMMD791]|uniref:hypothetical protein n=1 Tax=Solwaraspora sp. WMMD791 TaxID=3016086 RepID=UPI00249B0078|nr:hypothetical protein [Solwaraspora sp. WMMD791]WFE29645.1 hypothetical protein O7623_10850 [Solwaraspora sp. WMMD791]